VRTTAIVLHRFGGPEVLEPAELELPPPGPGEVLLRVHAVALNPVDLLTRRGAPHLWPPERQRFPLVIGWDAAGEVEAVGPGVAEWAPGDRVIAMSYQPKTYRGTYTEHVVLDVEDLGPWPEGASPGAAAALPLRGLTALQAMAALEPRPGERVLVNGPLGGVGSLAVGLAAAAGAEVVGAARPGDADRARAYGVAQVVDREALDVGRPVDAVFDVVGGPAAVAAFGALRDGGRYVSAVPLAQHPGGPEAGGRRIAVHHLLVARDPVGLRTLAAAYARGDLRVDVAHELPLARAADAHRLAEAGGVRGRIVLRAA
jgi:NADPH:quinone reductase